MDLATCSGHAFPISWDQWYSLKSQRCGDAEKSGSLIAVEWTQHIGNVVVFSNHCGKCLQLLHMVLLLAPLHVAVAENVPRQIVAVEVGGYVWLLKVMSPQKVGRCVLVEGVDGVVGAVFPWTCEREECFVLEVDGFGSPCLWPG